MSPRGRHVDLETTDPFGLAPVPESRIPAPRGAVDADPWSWSEDRVVDDAWPRDPRDTPVPPRNRRGDPVGDQWRAATGGRSARVDGTGSGRPRRPVRRDDARARPRVRTTPDDEPELPRTPRGDRTRRSDRTRRGTGPGVPPDGDVDRRGRTGPRGAEERSDLRRTTARRTAARSGSRSATTARNAAARPAREPSGPARSGRVEGRDGRSAAAPVRVGPGPSALGTPGRSRRRIGAGPVPIGAVIVAVVIGTAVAVGLGVGASVHRPTGVLVSLAGFSSGAAAKAWIGSLVLLLVVVQAVTGRLRRRGNEDPMIGFVHRWGGRAAVLVSVPVAVQCLYAFGFSTATSSSLIHSVLGCAFYGVFVTKMLLLRRPGVPSWLLGVAGGLLFAVFAGVWLSSALWFFTGHGLSF